MTDAQVADRFVIVSRFERGFYLSPPDDPADIPRSKVEIRFTDPAIRKARYRAKAKRDRALHELACVARLTAMAPIRGPRKPLWFRAGQA